jgi:small subunit ribosomal protein S2
MASVAIKDLLEAGAHFGHQTRRWNPKMGRFIYGARGGVHIIDLTKTSTALEDALRFVTQTTQNGGKVLFVGTKRQGKMLVKAAALSADQPYVVERWLGGMLTNHRTITAQVNRLKKLENQLESGEIATRFNKKETADLTAECEKLEHIFGGIKHLDGLPAAVFVVDVPREMIAVAEARKLGIPVIAVVDTNADPDLIDYVIPANDDAIKTIKIISEAVAAAAREGAQVAKAAVTTEETTDAN